MTRIRLEYQGHVAYITLDHPPANTWTLASLQAFLQMMVELDGRPDVVALVIRGAGDKFFCAGAPLNHAAAFGHYLPASWKMAKAPVRLPAARHARKLGRKLTWMLPLP